MKSVVKCKHIDGCLPLFVVVSAVISETFHIKEVLGVVDQWIDNRLCHYVVVAFSRVTLLARRQQVAPTDDLILVFVFVAEVVYLHIGTLLVQQLLRISTLVVSHL